MRLLRTVPGNRMTGRAYPMIVRAYPMIVLAYRTTVPAYPTIAEAQRPSKHTAADGLQNCQ